MKTRDRQKEKCLVCHSTKVEIFNEMPGMPAYCNVLHKDASSARLAARGDIELGFCSSCGHIFNAAYKGLPAEYSEEYENSLHYSPVFQSYAEKLASSLVKKHNLYGKTIIELGCGKGDFLLMLSELGGNKGYGFDKSYVPGRAAEKAGVVFVQDFYSEEYRHLKGDLVCSRHVLEHIERPTAFMKDLRQTFAGESEAIVFFEVPNVMYNLKDLGIWDLIYEHVSYFSSESLGKLFSSSGFAVRETWEDFHGQFLCIEAVPARKGNAAAGADDPSPASLDILAEKVRSFREAYDEKLRHWNDVVRGLEQAGKKAVVWGGGSKGVTFLNALKAGGSIEYIVDINPNKVDRFVPVSAQRVVPPEFLPSCNPDIVIVMNSNYVEEIRGSLAGMGLAPEIMTA